MVLVAELTIFYTVFANELVASVTDETVEVVVSTIVEVVLSIAPEIASVISEKPKEQAAKAITKITTTFFMQVYCQIVIKQTPILSIQPTNHHKVTPSFLVCQIKYPNITIHSSSCCALQQQSSMKRVSMFSRNFMKEFPIRKYADITAKTGSMNTDIWIRNQKEIRARKPLLYGSIVAILLLMFSNFHTADEMIGHIQRPLAYTIYENKIPKEVLQPNQQIIAGWQAINKMNELKSTLEYDN